MPLLSDGTVIPSFMSVDDTSSDPASSESFFSNWTVRAGEVVAMYCTNDKENLSKTQVEYIVDAHYRDGNGISTIVPYRCVIGEGFGSAADHSRYSLRTRTKQENNKITNDGARVLIAFPNGDSSQGVIIACLANSTVTQSEAKRRYGNSGEQGVKFLSSVFNGVTATIDNDGALSVVVAGATKTDGSADQREDTQKGSLVEFSKTGQIKISDSRDGVNDSIVVDPVEKTITISAENFTVKAEQDIVLDGQGNTYIGSDNASENLVLGQKLVTALSALIDIFTQTPLVGIGTGNLGAPVPVPLFPGLMAQLLAWKIQHLQAGVVPPILSSKKFTE